MKALKRKNLLGFRLCGTHVDKPDGVLRLGRNESPLSLLFCPVGLKVEGAPHIDLAFMPVDVSPLERSLQEICKKSQAGIRSRATDICFRLTGESAKGTAPSAARRTVCESLDSHGSPYRALPYHNRQWTNSSDSRRDTFASQRRLRCLCPRRVLYFRRAHQASVRSKWRKTFHTSVG